MGNGSPAGLGTGNTYYFLTGIGADLGSSIGASVSHPRIKARCSGQSGFIVVHKTHLVHQLGFSIRRWSFGVFISQGLFLGSIGAAHHRDGLKKLNITHILTVGSSLAPAYRDEFVYEVLNVVDKESTDLKQQFDEHFTYIKEAKRSGGVLVHCFVGKSKSVTIVLAYLMKRHGMSLNEALEHERSRLLHASPNVGFLTSSTKSHFF
ncbi:dual specificity protein phosphatase 1B-like [Argentina anserina]|uniref:dual specificity protein phosphatase 1B-like n=1 Tax=Argentina anserina TaxID=57926 RepID=UPI00217646AF|nr:dual specificity protein phosphatase 1B-like [Potentilla anserina]